MIQVNIPAYGEVLLRHLVMDYNGTLAIDGIPVKGVKHMLDKLMKDLKIHIITADTFGKVREELDENTYTIHIIRGPDQAKAKLDYINQLDPKTVVALGNGRNDRFMLKHARIGICLLQDEGASPESLLAADIVSTNIIQAFHILMHPKRLIATLRS